MIRGKRRCLGNGGAAASAVAAAACLLCGELALAIADPYHRRVIDQTSMVFGQMNEAPGARLRVALSALTIAEYCRDTARHASSRPRVPSRSPPGSGSSTAAGPASSLHSGGSDRRPPMRFPFPLVGGSRARLQ